MTPMIDLLTDHGPMLLAGSSVLLGIGAVAMLVFGRPVERQRLGEFTLAATIAWLLLACVPLPRWEIGVGELIAAGESDTNRIEESRVGVRVLLDEPWSNPVADAPAGFVAVEEGSGGPENVADGEESPQPSGSDDCFAATVVPTVESSPVAVKWRVGWPRTLAALYGVGVVVCMVWLSAGHVLLARTERIATAPDAWLEDLYASVTSGRGVKRARLLVSSGCRRPAVYGIRRPVIMLPRELCRPENSERLRHVLRHESAHVWRGDARGNLIMNAAFAFLFFHPLFWWIRHRIQFSRELIADDWAAGLSSKESYADELVQLVSQGRPVRLDSIGVLGVFRFNTTFYRRMKMLIDRKQPLATSLPLTGKILGIFAGVMVVAAMACVAGVPWATAEGEEAERPAVGERPNREITDEPGIAGEDSGGGETAGVDSAESEARQPVDEAIRAALKDVPNAKVQTVRDAKTGRVSVTVEVPAEHFSRVWLEQQQKAFGKSRRGGMAGSGAADSGMTSGEKTGAMIGSMAGEMMGGMMGPGGGDEEGTGGDGTMGMEMIGPGMGGGGSDTIGPPGMMSGPPGMMSGGQGTMMGMGGIMSAPGMGMPGMGMPGMGMPGMGMEGGFGLQIPEDQLKRTQIDEANNIREMVTVMLGKAEPDAADNASVDVSVVRDIRLEDWCFVRLIDDAKIPAQAEGLVVELVVREGDRVERGQMLARIDDRRAKLKVEEVKGLLEEARGKDLDVRYAELTADLAIEDYESALEANRKAAGTVSNAEIVRLAMQAEVARIRVAQTERAKAGTRAQEAQLALAESELSNYRTEAPLDGIVVEVFPHVGEWVRSGDPICHIVEMSRLQVEARLDASKYSPDEVRGSDVIIEFTSHGRVERVPGKVTFVSPLVEGDSRFKLVAEISNRARDGQYLLRPGMQVTTVVKLVSRPGGR